MIYGDVIRLSSKGLHIREKALQPLGVFDQSLCWAVWVESREKGARNPHLIVSPFHPASWPFLIRIRFLLEEEPGNLAKALEFLCNNDLSILYNRCTPTGFHHATWEVIAESTKEELDELRKEKEDLDKNNALPRVADDRFEKAREISTKIAAAMFVHVHELEEELKQMRTPQGDERGDRARNPRLHIWSEKSGEGFDRKALIASLEGRKEFRDMKKKRGGIDGWLSGQIMPPTRVRYMHRLAAFSIFGGGREVPFALEYSASEATLRMDTEQILAQSRYRDLLRPLPMAALASFDGVNKFLRVRPVVGFSSPNSLVKVLVRYTVSQDQHDAKVSMGMLEKIVSALSSEELDVVDISNKWTQYRYAAEAGLISLIGELEPSRWDRARERLLALNFQGRQEGCGQDTNSKAVKENSRVHGRDGVSNGQDEDASSRGGAGQDYNVRIDSVVFSPLPKRNLFVSLRFGHPREQEVRRLLEQVAGSNGFQAQLVETYTEPVTPAVHSQVTDCEAFLQILWFRVDEPPDEASFSWLDFEYGLTYGKNRPSIRMIDTVIRSYDWWQSRVATNLDHRLMEFRSDANTEDLRERFDLAISKLAATLTKRQL